MKNFKNYEDFNNSDLFKIGDIVICVDNDYTTLTINDKYKVIKSVSNLTGTYIDVINIKTGYVYKDLYSSRFEKEINNNIKKYNL